MPRIRHLFLVAFLFLFAITSTAYSQASKEKRCSGGACFAGAHTLDGNPLPLKGISLFEYWSFDVYTAALYADASVKGIDAVLGDVPKYLVLEYHRGLEKQNIIDNSEYALQENSDNDMKALRKRLGVLYENYKEVKDGDRFSMSYLPGEGTTLYFNGEKRATLPGVDFQKAYFGIWLSRSSVDEDFTKELLGG